MTRTLVFDLDGTLAETAPDIMGTLNHLLAREGLAPLPLAEARNLVGMGAKTLLERGFAAAGRSLPHQKLEPLFQDFLGHYLEHVADLSFLYPGAEAALERLRARGFILAICTNKPERHACELLQRLGIHGYFAAIAGRETFPYAKPDPRHLLETIALASGEASRAIMIGDSRTDVDTARAAAIPVIGVTFGYSDTPMAALNPDRVISNFDTLEAAIDGIWA